MSKKNYTVQWIPDITVTAGNGSISIADTKTGGTDTATIYDNTVYGAGEYEWPSSLIGHSIGEQKPLHINDKEVEAIPIEWIEEWGWKNGMSESMSLRVMIDDWEKENETN